MTGVAMQAQNMEILRDKKTGRLKPARFNSN